LIKVKLARILVVASALLGMLAIAAPAPSQWEQPASQLAEQVAGILGPGQAQLTIRNLSTLSASEIPTIRRLLEQDLKAHGVVTSGAESANLIRITLSESARERMWVAEVVEGNETRVAMIHFDRIKAQQAQTMDGLTLRKQVVLTVRKPILGAFETGERLIAIEPEQIVVYGRAADGWQEQKTVSIEQKRPLTRDPRAIVQSATGQGFEAWLAGTECTGIPDSQDTTSGWAIRCTESDDPWIILQSQTMTPGGDATTGAATPALKAFFNASRNYFTGVVTPSLGVDLPPFYSASLLPRPVGGAALLINGIDGRVQLEDQGKVKSVEGTRDWGSDIAVLHSVCGAGSQVIVSGSGEADSDSLRAYQLPAQEAIAVSAPLTMAGSVTAIWSAQDGKSVMVAVRNAASEYEVDRVTALCN
jgi:hypothetical protein